MPKPKPPKRHFAILPVQGEIRVGKPNRPDLYPSPPGLMSDEEVAALMDEVRGDR